MSPLLKNIVRAMACRYLPYMALQINKWLQTPRVEHLAVGEGERFKHLVY